MHGVCPRGNQPCRLMPAMPNARFKSRTTFIGTPRRAVQAIPKRKPGTVDFAGIPGAKPAVMPATIAPQLATLVRTPPTGAGWVHEVKYDGYRMLCRIEGGDVRIISRNGKEWTGDFPGIAATVAKLPVESAWIDREICVVDALGRSSFQALQNVLSNAPGTLVYFTFDLLYADRIDLRGAALVDRKSPLQTLLEAAPGNIQYSDHFDAPGPEFHKNVCKLGLEGMVSKRADGRFQAGRSRVAQGKVQPPARVRPRRLHGPGK